MTMETQFVYGLPPEDYVTQAFLTKPDERGNRKLARVEELIEAFDDKLELDPNRCKFKITYDNSELEDIMSYNEILDYVERNVNNEDGDRWNFRKVLKHQVIPSKECNKSVVNIQMLWETGAVSTESLEQLAKEIQLNLHSMLRRTAY